MSGARLTTCTPRPSSACGIARTGDPEALAASGERPRLVDEDRHAHSVEPLTNLRPPRIDVMIPGYREHAKRRGKGGERAGKVLDVQSVVVDLIAGDRDHLGSCVL